MFTWILQLYIYFWLLQVVQQCICEASLHLFQINLKISSHTLDFWDVINANILLGSDIG